MSRYTIKLVATKRLSAHTKQFNFEKPAGFSYKPGQCADFTISSGAKSDDQGSTRTFTLASAPHEKIISVITQNTKSAFKKALFSLKPRESLLVEGPFGTFFLSSQNMVPVVCIAGGIGVTPFVSFFKSLIFKKDFREISLLYLNRGKLSALGLEIFSEYTRQNKNFSFGMIDTSLSESSSRKARLNKKIIERYVQKNKKQEFLLSGPISFVVDVREILLELGVTDDCIRTDDFSGYSNI